MKLANETVAAAQPTVISFVFLCRIRKGGAANIVRSRGVAVSVRRLDRRAVNNETKQHKRERASKRTVRLD